MKPKLVYLEWADAVGNSHWRTTEEALRWAKTTEWHVRQVGWIIHEDDKSITFAASWKTEDEYCTEQFGDLHKIPKTWIRCRKNLKT
jgi:hypothetical protein